MAPTAFTSRPCELDSTEEATCAAVRIIGRDAPMEMHEKFDHVVLLMLENRSLDNVLGWLYAGDQPDDKPQRFVGADMTPRYNGLQGVQGVTKGTLGATGTNVPAQPMRVPGFDPNEQYEHTNQQLFGSAAKPTNQNPPYGTP